MKKYHLAIATTLTIEAESPEDARREFEAEQEKVGHSDCMSEDLLLNADIINIEENVEDLTWTTT